VRLCWRNGWWGSVGLEYKYKNNREGHLWEGKRDKGGEDNRKKVTLVEKYKRGRDEQKDR
jgi:hypothetical protein